MTYTIVLIAIILLALISRGLAERWRVPFFLFSCFLILGLLSGFRYQGVTSDFQVNYRRVLQAYSMSWQETIHYSAGFVHQIFRKLVAVIFHDPQWYFVLSSLFMVGMFMRCAKRFSPDVFLFVLLYYAVFSFFVANNVTRQGIAVAVSLMAWDSLLEKRPIKCAIIMAFAVFIHVSAVFFVPLYFLSHVKFNRNTLYGYILLGVAVVVFRSPVVRFFQRFIYSDYTEGSFGTTGSNPLHIALAALTLFMMILYIFREENNSYRMEEPDEYMIRYKNFILHGSFMFIMCYVLSVVHMAMFTRLAMYFKPCAILCIIHGIESERRTRNYHVYRIGVILFAIAWFALMNYSGKLIPTPYTPFWEFPERLLILP